MFLAGKPHRAARACYLPLNPQSQVSVLHGVGSQQILDKCIEDQFIAQDDIIKKTLLKQFKNKGMKEREIKLTVQY